jgi:hypothetical protein
MCCPGVCVRRARVCAWCLWLAACVRARSMTTHPRSPCDSDLCKCPLPKHSTHVEPAVGRCHRTISTHTQAHTKFLYHARCDTVKLYETQRARERQTCVRVRACACVRACVRDCSHPARRAGAHGSSVFATKVTSDGWLIRCLLLGNGSRHAGVTGRAANTLPTLALNPPSIGPLTASTREWAPAGEDAEQARRVRTRARAVCLRDSRLLCVGKARRRQPDRKSQTPKCPTSLRSPNFGQ